MKNIVLNFIHKTHEIINSGEFKERSRMSENQFTRNRKMSFQKAICFCLNFIKKSLQLELDDFVELLDEETESPITKQAFSKARQHISPKAFEELFLMTSEVLLNNDEAKKYNGYRIFAIDGTELELSRSKELAKEYPPSRNTTAPRARVSILCEVLEGSILHASMQNLSVDERTLALQHLDYFKETVNHSENSLFIFDRGYPSKNLLEYFEKNNMNYLMRLQKSFSKEIDETSKHDFYVDMKNHKRTMNVRVIKLTLPSGEEETLISNLPCNQFKTEEFQQLYFMRWGVETKYNTIKNKLQIEDFSGKTVISVQQDFYATMYLSNMVSAIKMKTDDRIEEDNRSKTLNNTYKTNENLLIGKLKNNLILILLNEDSQQRERLLNRLIHRISTFKVAVVPDRQFPRPTEAHKKTRSKVKRVL